MIYQKANKIKKANIAENNPIASTKAKAKIDNENSSDFKEGFLAVPFINAENTIPAPAAAPAKPIEAIPAPMNFAASIIFLGLTLNLEPFSFPFYSYPSHPSPSSLKGMGIQGFIPQLGIQI